MQFIRDPFAIPFPFKYDRCSLAAEAALTSMSLQWTFITLEIQYLVLMREAWYSSWSQSTEQNVYRDTQHCCTILEIEGVLDYLKTIAPEKAVSSWIDQIDIESKNMLVWHSKHC